MSRHSQQFFTAILITLFVSPLSVFAQRKAPGDPSRPGGGTSIIGEERYIDRYYQHNVGKDTLDNIFIGGERIATLRNGTDVYFPLDDHAGSPTQITNAQGGVTELRDYKPFGPEAFSQVVSPSGNTKKFLDKQEDSENGLQYFGARYYTNQQARFSSIDSVLLDPQSLVGLAPDPQQLNSYAYGRNNPLVWSDPSGLRTELITRPVQDTMVGAHAFILITNTAEDAQKLIDVHGISDKTRITMSGYSYGSPFFGDLVKQANEPYDYYLSTSEYIGRSEIPRPDSYSTQLDFENSILHQFNELPGVLGAYSLFGNPRAHEQANSNNTASTVLLRAGVPSETIIGLARGNLHADYKIAPGLGTSVPPYQRTSVQRQLNVVKYLTGKAWAGMVHNFRR